MGLLHNFSMMAVYNQRINAQLLSCCRNLSIDELNQDSKSFFASIIDYWNHLLFGDLILLGRLANNNIANFSKKTLQHFPKPFSTTDSYFQDLEDIVEVRSQLDILLVKFFDDLTAQELTEIISYQTTEGEQVSKPVALICQHIFNHQTHHRGQLTCVLSQLGVDYGCMDLPVIVADY